MAAATAWKEPYIHVSLHASVQMDNEHDSKLICYNNPGWVLRCWEREIELNGIQYIIPIYTIQYYVAVLHQQGLAVESKIHEILAYLLLFSWLELPPCGIDGPRMGMEWHDPFVGVAEWNIADDLGRFRRSGVPHRKELVTQWQRSRTCGMLEPKFWPSVQTML